MSADLRSVLHESGTTVTSGDVPGYVPDKVCAECHSDKADSFADMGMARSFYRPSNDKVIETFSPEAYFHEPTQRLYGMELRDGAYWFTRHTRTPQGDLIDEVKIEVNWIMGSGNHSRVYLYQTKDGALFQLPLAWYSQSNRWAMAPGFEFEDHLGIGRNVPQRCMACHNAFADYPKGSGESGMPRLYPHDLPEGIGCQRCHGPGAEHVAKAYSGEASVQELHEAITHPGKLPRTELYSICYGCHMQPSVAVNSQLRLGRSDYGFRPGEDLGQFIAHIDIVDAKRPKHARFDINHHPYRLEQSACFVESKGALGCLTCHDPHVKIKPDQRAAHYRQACLSCHALDNAGFPETAGAEAHPEIGPEDDCTICHMPNRRTQDVTEVWMTDHKITRKTATGLLNPIAKESAVVSEVLLMDRSSDVPDDEALTLKLIAILQHTARTADYASDELAQHLQDTRSSQFEPYLHLMQSYIRQGRVEEARALAGDALSRNPDHPQLILVTAMAYALTGDVAFGVKMLRNLSKTRPELVDARYNLALLLRAEGKLKEAKAEAEQVVSLRPLHRQAWRLLAQLATAQGDQLTAIKAYLHALEADPRQKTDRADLIKLLIETGQVDAAEQHRAVLGD